jgi:hypothetical protein
MSEVIFLVFYSIFLFLGGYVTRAVLCHKSNHFKKVKP